MQQKKRKMSPTTIAIGNDLLRHLSNRVHNVCADAADTGERAGLDYATIAVDRPDGAGRRAGPRRAGIENG